MAATPAPATAPQFKVPYEKLPEMMELLQGVKKSAEEMNNVIQLISALVLRLEREDRLAALLKTGSPSPGSSGNKSGLNFSFPPAPAGSPLAGSSGNSSGNSSGTVASPIAPACYFSPPANVGLNSTFLDNRAGNRGPCRQPQPCAFGPTSFNPNNGAPGGRGPPIPPPLPRVIGYQGSVMGVPIRRHDFSPLGPRPLVPPQRVYYPDSVQSPGGRPMTPPRPLTPQEQSIMAAYADGRASSPISPIMNLHDGSRLVQSLGASLDDSLDISQDYRNNPRSCS